MNTLPEKFPEPDCPESGYSWYYIEELLNEEALSDFKDWMYGQTMTICDGRKFNHDTREYEPTSCVENPHGGVVYSWDFRRYFGLYEQRVKDLWD